MPQVIPVSVELELLEKKIYESFAKSVRSDVFLYNADKKAVVYDSSLSGYHFHFNAVPDRFYTAANFDETGRLRKSHITIARENDWAVGNVMWLPAGTEVLASFSADTPFFRDYSSRFIVIPFNPFSPSFSVSERIMVHLAVLGSLIGGKLKSIPIDFEDPLSLEIFNIVANATVDERVRRIERERAKLIAEIKDSENILRQHYLHLQQISRQKIERQPVEHTTQVLNQVKLHPEIAEIGLEFQTGGLALSITTKHLVVSLPGGDLPFPPIRVIINTSTLTTRIESLICTDVTHVHCHRDGAPCWGGFESMLFNAISLFDIPTVISIIIAWVSTYNPSSRLNSLQNMAAQMGISIESESPYLLEGGTQNVVDLTEEEVEPIPTDELPEEEGEQNV